MINGPIFSNLFHKKKTFKDTALSPSEASGN